MSAHGGGGSDNSGCGMFILGLIVAGVGFFLIWFFRVTETTSVTVWVDRTPIYVPPPKAVYVPPAPVKTTVTLYPSSWVSDLVFIDRTYGRRWVLTSDDIPTRRWTEIRGCYVENGDGTWSFSTNCLKYKFTGRVEGIR